jgi:hypothetical protein
MQAQQRGRGRANALKGELSVRLEETSRAPAEAVYDLLADISSHLEWGGRAQPKTTYRLLSVDAPEGRATVGTEFASTGADGMGTFADSSVVTEATRPSLFEFVTEAKLSTKKGVVVEWTNVHRYELEPRADGCRIVYTVRILRMSELPGPLVAFKIPGLRALGLRVGGANSRKGLRNLARLAEERAETG